MHQDPPTKLDPAGGDPLGVLVALPGEAGPLLGMGENPRSILGQEIWDVEVAAPGDVPGPQPGRLLLAVSGVGKVAAARAASALITAGARGLAIAGTAGGLTPDQSVGTLVLCDRAIQWDLAVREGREIVPDPVLSRAWAEAVGGCRGATFLTADRPAIRFLERLRRARGLSNSARGRAEGVADMETAAAAAIAAGAGVPWAALRVISDRRPGWRDVLRGGVRGANSFHEGFRAHAHRPAESILHLVGRWRSSGGGSPGTARPDPPPGSAAG